MKKSRGFTLFELVIALAVIIVLVAIIIFSIVSAKNKAKDVSILNSIGEIRVAMAQYKLDNGDYPPANNSNQGIVGGDTLPQFLYDNKYISKVPVGAVNMYVRKCGTGNTVCNASGLTNNTLLFTNYLPCASSTQLVGAVVFNLNNASNSPYTTGKSGLSSASVICLQGKDLQ